MKKIKFHSARMYNSNDLTNKPMPSKSSFPDWWKNASLFFKDLDGNFFEIENSDSNSRKERALGFKACPALLDGFSVGYVLRTPTDIMFVQHNNEPFVIIDPAYKDFCAEREAIADFVVPNGYHSKHFHWWPNWGFETPDGYSALVLNPINRYDLPFITTTGIIDSDRYTSSGLMPFFLKEGFSGLVPKGTPFAQIVPIKRESWESEYIYHDEKSIMSRFEKTADTYRKPFGGIYKRSTWIKKEYT